ncbi:MAG: PAC2 family protein [Micrococcales bacterium]|nr:PAC2 family protein [Micrococcales bacterium]
MQNASELYRFETDTDLAALRPGVLIVALEGFIDAGRTQSLLAEHLLADGKAHVVASFDVDQLLDYRGRRPVMTFDSNRWASYADPSLLLYRLQDRDGQAYYLLTGAEPDYQWERVVEAITQLIDVLRVNLTVTAHGIPMAVPHTRPVGITRYATDPRLLSEGQEPVFGRVQVPGGLMNLLHLRLGESGRHAVGFAVHVPHYLAQGDFPDGSIAALNAIVDHTGLNLPNDSLVSAAALSRGEVTREIEGNDEAAQVVSALEHQYDAFVEGSRRPSLLSGESEQVPSGEEIAAEFEEFLKGLDEEPEDS